MAAALIFIPGAMPSFDRNGDTCVGELYFYVPGTFTPKDVYTDNTLATTLPFPVVSDGSGVFPAIWADDAESFDVVWVTIEASPRTRSLSGVQPAIDVIEAEGPEGPQGEPGTNGTNGTDGTDGDNGWSPVLAVATDGERRVFQVTDWSGGEGTKPTTGLYVGASGLVADIADGINVRGAAGSGIGDLLAANNLSDVAIAATALANLGGLAKAGGTMTGAITLAADAVNPLEPASKQQLDAAILNAGKRGRCRAATTANITISTALNNGDTLDGVTLATGDLVLVKDQSAGEQNGIYVVGVTPARSPEFDTWAEYPGSLISVEEGTANADTLWICTSNDGGTLGTTAIVFSRIRIDIAIPVAPAQGGTGATTLTAHGVVLGNGTSAVGVTGPGTSGQVLTSNGASADPTFQTITAGSGAPDVIVRDEQTSGTAGANSAATTWNTRVLNTVVRNVATIAALSSNQVTLPAGTYYVTGRAPAGGGNVFKHKLRLYNVTDSAAAIIGSSAYTGGGDGSTSFAGVTDAVIQGVVTIASSKAFRLEHYTQAAITGGLGLATGASVVEVYAELAFWKIA